MFHPATRSAPTDNTPELDLATAVRACREIAGQVFVLTDIAPDKELLEAADPPGLVLLSLLIRTLAQNDECPFKRTKLSDLSDRMQDLALAIEGSLPVPKIGDLLWRHATGEIDSTTACLAAGCSYDQWLEQCRFHGWSATER